MKRTGRLKRKSRKRATKDREVQPIREAFKREIGWCMYPGCKRQATDTHEIVGGGSKGTTIAIRELWLALCRSCHDEIQGLPQSRKHAVELAVKYLGDREWYSLEVFRRAKSPLREAVIVTEEEVQEVVKQFQSNGGEPGSSLEGRRPEVGDAHKD